MVDEREYDLAFANPSSITYMALKGVGAYTSKMEIRNLAVFPSWDRICFAVKRDLGVRSLREIGAKKIPLNLSTRGQGPEGTTVFTIRTILSFYGWRVEDVQAWGGSVDAHPIPEHPKRREGLEKGLFDSVFDEGIRHWADLAIAKDMIFLSLEDGLFAELERLGFRRVIIPKAAFEGLGEEIHAVEFGGWPLYCRADLPDEMAYLIVKAIDLRKETIPVDADRLDMSRICRDTEEGPLCIPLHPGAERYYKEKGYL